MRGIIKRAAVVAMSAMTLLAAKGEIRWLQTEHNFGAFDEDDGTVECKFVFTNKGPEEVSIRSARASCGCTMPHYPHDVIAPGDSAAITVAYNPTGRPGHFNKTIRVNFSDDNVQTLVISGVVIGSQNTLRSRYPFEAGPMKLRSRQVPFGTVLKGKGKSAVFEVYNASHEPIVPEWRNVPSYLRISTVSDTINPGEQGVYSLVMTPGNTEIYGILTDSAQIVVPGNDPVKVDLTAILEEDFSKLTPGEVAKSPQVVVDNQRIDFGEFPADGGEVTRSFTIENRGKSDLLLRRVYTTDPGVSVRVDADKVKKGKSTMAYITVDPSALTSPLLNARVQIIANDPAMPITIVRAVGIPK